MMAPFKPFISYQIDRYSGAARVWVFRCVDAGEGLPVHRETLADYETAGRGATASARREVARQKRAQAEQVSA